MKRILTLMLAAALTLSLSACGRRAGDGDTAVRDSNGAAQGTQTITEQESIERKLIKVVSDNYVGAEIDHISVEDNEQTTDAGDYEVQALLTWGEKSDTDQIRRSLITYSGDFATRVSKETPNVSAFTVSWSVPNIDANQVAVEYSYERKGGAMQELESVVSDKLGGMEAVEQDKAERAPAGQSASSEGTAGTQGGADSGDVPAADAANQQEREEALNGVLAVIEETLKNGYDTNYTLNHDDTSITVGVWRAGVADGAVYAQQGDQSCLSAWRTMVTAIQNMSSTMTGSLRAAGFEDMKVTVNVVNDQNHDNVLLTVTDGTVTYNWVEPDTQQAA